MFSIIVLFYFCSDVGKELYTLLLKYLSLFLQAGRVEVMVGVGFRLTSSLSWAEMTVFDGNRIWRVS